MPKKDYYLPSRRLVSQDDAAMIQRANVPRSKFSGSWTHKTTFDAALLIPFMVDEVLPGDHLRYNVTAYVRMSTPLFPLFDNQRIDTFFFYVPCRLLWDNWAKFMGEQANPGDSIAYTIPTIPLTVVNNVRNTVFAYMGIPDAVGTSQVTGDLDINALPLRAYNLIWNEWFRDQNLINSAVKNTDDGPDSTSDYPLQRRAKSHDYFTSALPWPQKFTAPTVPLGGLAPVLGIGAVNTNIGTYAGGNVYQTPSLVASTFINGKLVEDPATVHHIDNRMVFAQAANGSLAIYADLSQATGVAINTFRQAMLVQQLLERDARGGTRYVELIKSHFGVTNPDFRLQRPEYIGGGQTGLNITPIAQTAPTTGVPLGALGAAGTAAGQHSASYAATEHGYIIGIINVRTELSYQQGLHKLWSRRTRYDFYWPSLSGLGEQAILRQELYATGVNAADETVFGYQERWHEYRTNYSIVTGVLRSTAAGTLDAWHLAQLFTSAPSLNQVFIQDTPPMARVLAAGALADGQQYLADLMISRTAVRPIPTFGTPVTLGRF